MGPSLHDTRLLANLLKTEKDAQVSFRAWSRDSASASTALSAWSVADSGDTQDLMDVALRISRLLANCSDSQRDYLEALSAYRTSLKDVLERETSLKTIVRDREILVGRLIKLGNKKPTDAALENHEHKLEEAQRELEACEAYLQSEEAALNGVKRRNFREALSMRMKSMGELGKIMEESSRQAVTLLSQLGQCYPLELELGSAAGDSIAPSHSASQALSAASSSSTLDPSEYPSLNFIPPPHQLAASSVTPDFSIAPQAPPHARMNASLSAVDHQRRISVLSSTSTDFSSEYQPRSRTPVPPRPVLPPVPVAPRGITSDPTFYIPRAPPNVSTRAHEIDSSDEEEEREYVAHKNAVVSHQQQSRALPFRSPLPVTLPGSRLRKQEPSDTSERGGSKKSSTGFLGGIASLFRKKAKRDEDDSDDAPRRSLRKKDSSNWDMSRTDKNVFAATRAGSFKVVARSGSSAGQLEDTSDEESMPKNVVRVVNNRSARMHVVQDMGVSRSMSMATITPAPSPKARLEKKVKKKIVGQPVVAPVVPSPLPPVPDTASAAPPKKKKKKAPTVTADQSPPTVVLTVPTPVTSTTNLSRSNTVNTFATTTTTAAGTTKRRRPKVASAPTIPTAADLAASLPSARSSLALYETYDPPHPPASPTLPTTTASNSTPVSTNAPPPSRARHASVTGAGAVPKSLERVESRSKKDSALYGNGPWVQSGPPTTTTPASTQRRVVPTTRKHEMEEKSLMSLVERENTRVNGVIAAPVDTRSQGSQGSEGAPSTSRQYGERQHPALPHSNSSLSPSSAGGANLVKRKSVRLVDPSFAPAPSSIHSPGSSIRSDSSPRHGILVNGHKRTPSPVGVEYVNGNSHVANGSGNASLPAPPPSDSRGWETRVSRGRGGVVDDDSSDEEDEEQRAYAAVKRQLEYGTRELERSLKGKGREIL